MKMRLQGLCAGIFALLIWAAPAAGEPYIAIREGLKCSQCHANITGGGMRTVYANTYSQQELPMTYYAPWKDLPAPGSGEASDKASKETEAIRRRTDQLLSGQVTDFLSWGTDLRFSNETQAVPNADNTNTFSVGEATLYLQGVLIPDHLYVYLDALWESSMAGGPAAREVFGLIRGLPLEGYIKAGKFFVPHGLRLQDDSAFIRSSLPGAYNMTASEVGVEAGIEPGPLSLSVAVTNGNNSNVDSNADKQVNLLGTIVQENFRVGGSFAFNPGMGSDYIRSENGFGGFTYGRFTLLGEFDHAKQRTGGAVSGSQALLGELNVLLTQGLNAKASYEFYNPSLAVAKDEQNRWSFILECFVTQFAQARAGARILDNRKPSPWSADGEIYFAELHFFL